MSQNFVPRVVLLTMIPYMVLFGASFNTVIVPALQVLHLTMLALALAVWAGARVRSGWKWHPTVLDGVLWFWIAAIALAALANPETVRRSQPALWFITAMLVGWYVLHDAFANGAVTRAQIVDLFLLAGVVTMAFAAFELFDPAADRDGLFGLPRVGGFTGNPNLLSALLVPMIGLAFGRAWSLRGVGRVLMGLYTAAAVALLLLTYSRGGWLGGGAAIGVLILAFATQQGWLTPAGARSAWRAAKGWQRSLAVAVLLGGAAAALIVGVVLIDSLDDRGRSADLRTYLWTAAWDSFTEKPLTGNGLFTMPRLILDRSSVPPRTAQPHAHNFPLQVLAELGVLGGAAMATSLYAVFRAGVRAWRGAATTRERQVVAAGWAASVGFGVHNLFDLTAWTPYVTLSGFIVLLVMTAPVAPVPLPARRGRVWAWAVGLIALVVVATGIYSHTQYARYDAILRHGREAGQALAAAGELDALIAADPRQPVYRWTQGILLAAAAYETGDAALTARARDHFAEAGELGMDSAVLRLNLAALSAELGDRDAAHVHFERMADYAPDSTVMLVNAALAAERWEMPDTARMLWTRLLEIGSISRTNIALIPAVAESAIAAEFAVPPLYQHGQAIALLADGRAAEAAALLTAHPEWDTTAANAVRALAAHALGDDPQPHLARAEAVRFAALELRWIAYADAVITGAETPFYALLPPPGSLDVTDEPPSAILPRLHFMRQIYNRMIVPQAGYDHRDFGFAALAQ